MEINKKKVSIIFLIVAFALINVFGYSNNKANADTAANQTQNEIDKTQKEIDRVTAELAALNNQKYRNQVQINATQALLNSLTSDISRQEAELTNLKQRAELNKTMLAEYIRQIYYADQEDPLVKLPVFQMNLSDFSANFDGMIGIKSKIMDALAVIDDAKTQTEKAKAELADQAQTKQQALQSQKNQQAQVIGDVQETQATLAELQQKLYELQSDLNAVTGNSYNAKDIFDAIDYVNGKTGVPKGILFAFLTQESGRGKNTGQCAYDDMEQKATAAYKKYGKAHGWNYKPSIANLTYRKGLFEDLVPKLGYSKSKKVSCAIIPANFANYEPNQGGAMGVAQFMSDTWMYGGNPTYRGRVINATGNKNPDPWSLTDGTMALAFKVKDAGGTSTSSSAIKKMVTNYYGASPDSSSVARNYYNNIIYYVKNYDKLANN